MADRPVQMSKKRKIYATLTVVSLSATTLPPFASRIQSLVATAPASKAPLSPLSPAPDQALQAQAHIVVRTEMLMGGQTRRWLAERRIALRTIAGMCPTLVRRTLMETG